VEGFRPAPTARERSYSAGPRRPPRDRAGRRPEVRRGLAPYSSSQRAEIGQGEGGSSARSGSFGRHPPRLESGAAQVGARPGGMRAKGGYKARVQAEAQGFGVSRDRPVPAWAGKPGRHAPFRGLARPPRRPTPAAASRRRARSALRQVSRPGRSSWVPEAKSSYICSGQMPTASSASRWRSGVCEPSAFETRRLPSRKRPFK